MAESSAATPTVRSGFRPAFRPPCPPAASAASPAAPPARLGPGPTHALLAWAEAAAAGDAALASALSACLWRFRSRHACLFLPEPGPGWRGLVRLYRGAAAVTTHGIVRSAELFRIPDPGRFFSDPSYCASVLAATAWDDRGALFSPSQPPRRTREAPLTVDWAGAACLAAVDDQVRQFEYLVNAELRNDRGTADRLLEEVCANDAPAGVSPHRPLRRDLRANLVAALHATVAEEAPRALDAFRAALDSGRLDLLGRAGANSVSAHNWLAGRDGPACDPALARRRAQAAAAYPFAWTLLSAPTGPAAEAVALERPLAPALAAALGVTESALRRMNGLPPRAAGYAAAPEAHCLPDLARRVAEMPPGAAPRNEAGWRAFFAATALARAVDAARAVEADGTPLGRALMLRAAGRWDGLDAASMTHAAGGVADMARDVHANLALPAAALLGAMPLSVAGTLSRIIGSRSLDQLATACALWHERQADIRLRLATLWPIDPGAVSQETLAWRPLHVGGAWPATNGLLVTPLSDEDALIDEHHRMSHCVNQYAPNCLFEGCHILSVRGPGGESIATAEIRQSTLVPLAKSRKDPPDAPLDQLPPGVVQFRAPRNGVPPIRAWEALWEYVSAILTGALELDAKGLEEGLARRRASRKGEARSAVCYDATTPEAVTEAWRLYLALLPKAAAKRGPATFTGDAR